MMNKNRKIEVVQRKKSQFTHRRSPQENMFKTIFFNRFFFSIASGIAIGIIFGFLSLHVLTENGQPLPLNSDSQQASTPSSATAKESTANEPILIQGLYVVQLGLFQEAANANVGKDQFATKQVDAVIWNRNEGFYLFHSIYLDEQKAKEKVSELSEIDIDSFVKSWSIELDTSRLNGNEYASVQSLISLWKKSMEQVESEGSFSIEEWSDWVSKNSGNSPFITSLTDQLQNILTEYGAISDRTILFEIIKEVEQSIMS